MAGRKERGGGGEKGWGEDNSALISPQAAESARWRSLEHGLERAKVRLKRNDGGCEEEG